MMRTVFLYFILLAAVADDAVSQHSTHYSCKHSKNIIQEKDQPRAAANNSRSDTVDILNYTISLNITDFANKRISGNCAITLTPKINGTGTIDFDLYQLNVDSVKVNSSISSFTYSNDIVKVTLPSAANVGDPLIVTIYYNGNPKRDPSVYGGGFYFSGSYAYNIGVGFAVDPHNFGRAWFPCFDNFIERSTYEFFITTDLVKKAFCNGELLDTVNTGSTVIWHWRMNETIPTYLASVAVAPYATVHKTLTGTQGAVPVMLNALAVDTAKLKSSFIHLPEAFATFENDYGPHRFNRVGYNLVPEVGGAMEHATNIAYQRALVDGALTYETVMAHELAHHWWGDLVTCETVEDMWINEGMATYSEYLFLEDIYGYDRSIQEVKATRDAVLWKTHELEEGYRAVSGIPHKYTYGEHVYQKGSLVGHSLRGYLGDSLFFSGLKSFLDKNKFNSVSSYDMMNDLTAATGKDLTHFFNNWVFSPGFPHFSVDSVISIPDGSNYKVSVYVKQRLTGAPAFYTGVPLQVTFMDSLWNTVNDSLTASGENTVYTYTLPFIPALTVLNRDNKINQAVSDVEKTITAKGNQSMSFVRFKTFTVDTIVDSALVRIEHNWTAPGNQPYPNDSIRISPNRYWKVDGVFPAVFKARATITYNGKRSAYLDYKLLAPSEDKVILLYRKDASEQWRQFEYYTKNTVVTTDSIIDFSISDLLKGEYTFAYGNPLYLSTAKPVANIKKIKVFPNPATSIVTINMSEQSFPVQLKISNINGVVIEEKTLSERDFIFHTGHLMNGIYIINALDSEGTSSNEKLIIIH